jgi:hypothetical protein
MYVDVLGQLYTRQDQELLQTWTVDTPNNEQPIFHLRPSEGTTTSMEQTLCDELTDSHQMKFWTLCGTQRLITVHLKACHFFMS